MNAAFSVAVRVAALAGLALALASVPVDRARAVRGSAGERMFIANVCAWEGLDWYEMLPEAQRAWSRLGWTQRTWDANNAALAPRSDARGWSELSASERGAAESLGFDKSTWDSGKCRGAGGADSSVHVRAGED